MKYAQPRNSISRFIPILLVIIITIVAVAAVIAIGREVFLSWRLRSKAINSALVGVLMPLSSAVKSSIMERGRP